MKNKYMIGAVLMFSLLSFIGCKNNSIYPGMPEYNTGAEGSGSFNPDGAEGIGPSYPAGKELMCLAQSREEADKVAAQYGIELVEYKEGVATFHTDESPYTVVERGKKNGYHEIAVNGMSEVFEKSDFITDDAK